MNKNSQYAFYGSLRRGMENYRLFESDLNFLRTVELGGFKMFSLGPYPYIIRTGNSEDKIVGDLFIVTNRETEQTIHKMELDAGYIFSEVEIAGNKFGIYLLEATNADHPEVGGGDWSTFRKLSRF